VIGFTRPIWTISFLHPPFNRRSFLQDRIELLPFIRVEVPKPATVRSRLGRLDEIKERCITNYVGLMSFKFYFRPSLLRSMEGYCLGCFYRSPSPLPSNVILKVLICNSLLS
jgi:hypothetical protein